MDILGSDVDEKKFKSYITLFVYASLDSKNNIFRGVLNKLSKGGDDTVTLDLLRKEEK